jgi:ABC-type multidrug transport system fused ATPase/permease subunit
VSLLPTATPASVRRRAAALFRRHRRYVALSLVLQLLGAALGLVGPAVLGEMVDVVVRHGRLATIDRYAAIFAVALVLQSVLTWLGTVAASIAGEAALAELREDFVHALVELPLATVEDVDTGDLLSRASSDVKVMQDEIRQVVPVLAVAVLQIVFLVGGLAISAPLLLVTAPIGLVPLLFSTIWYRRRAPAVYRDMLATGAAISGHAVETAGAGRTVATFGLEQQRIRGADRLIGRLAQIEWTALRLRLIWFPSAELSYGLPLVGSLLLGGWLVYGGHLSLGALTAATLYVRQLVDPVDQLVSWLDELQIGSAAMARLLGIGEVPAALTVAGSPHGADVAADDVHFSYRPGHDVLDGLTLDVAAGSRVAVVGPSGAGKSTLARLVAGIARPRTGQVRVGGAEVGALAPEAVRTHVSLVTQEQHVFVGTLRDNLRLGRPEASDGQLTAALAEVGATTWSGALGLDAVVGSGAHALSPGQAQQLALARLLLVDPDVLVLDEATALLDPGSARDLERSLSAVLHGRTVVAIAHRLSTAFDADLVAVVEAGRVTDLGSHEELLAAGGAYADLWRSWQET